MARKPKHAAYFALEFAKDRWRRFALSHDLLALEQNFGFRKAPKKSSVDAAPKGADDDPVHGTQSDFKKHLEGFSKTFSGVYHTISITSFIRNHLAKSYATQNVIKYAEDNLESIHLGESAKIFGVPSAHLHEINKRTRDLTHFTEGTKTFPGLVLLGMVSCFDAQISAFVRLLLRKNPQTISKGNTDFDISTLLDFEDIDQLKDYVVDSEVYKLMHASHEDQIKYIEKTFKISISNEIESFGEFLEVFERRNLIAHSEGTVSEKYVKKCKSYGLDSSKFLKLGDSIVLDYNYLVRSADILFEFGFLLFWWMWIKVEKNEKLLAYASAIDVTFDLIVDERYALSSNILKSILKRHDADIEENSLRIMCVNNAICNKALDKSDWRKCLDQFKWDACTPNFKVCIAALDEDVKTVCELMPLVSSELTPLANRINEESFRTWPAFRWIRERDEFRDAFLKTFKVEIESKPMTDGSDENGTKNSEVDEGGEDGDTVH